MSYCFLANETNELNRHATRYVEHVAIQAETDTVPLYSVEWNQVNSSKSRVNV